jgi:TIR domain
MSSLADLPELVGFFSYSRKDDEDSDGALSKLRGRIQKELRLQLGRNFRLWQDAAAIPSGALWEDEIKRAIAESVFFIPIVTPSVAASTHCRFEFQSFLDREKQLGRDNLVFPILYIRVTALENESERRRDDVLTIIAARQYVDWQKIRHRDVASPEVAEKIEDFCRSIFEALHQPWSPQGLRKSEDAEAMQAADTRPRVQTRPADVSRNASEKMPRAEHRRPQPEAVAELGATAVTHLGTQAAVERFSERRFHFARSFESGLLGGVIGGAITGLFLGAYYYFQFNQIDEKVTPRVIAEMLAFCVLMGPVFGFCIQLCMLWFRYLVAEKRYSATLFNDVSGCVLGGALGGIPVGISAALAFGFRYQWFVGLGPIVAGTSLGVVFVAAGALFYDYGGRWQNVARAFAAALLIITCIATVEVVVLQVTGIEQWVYVGETMAKIGGAIVGMAIFSAAGLQVGLTLAAYRLWKIGAG